MSSNKQYKPSRTSGVGFTPPTLQRQHRYRLPFVKTEEANQEPLPATEDHAPKVVEEGMGATEGQEGESQPMTTSSQVMEDSKNTESIQEVEGVQVNMGTN